MIGVAGSRSQQQRNSAAEMGSNDGTDMVQALTAMLQQVTHGLQAVHDDEQSHELAGRPPRPDSLPRHRRHLPPGAIAAFTASHHPSSPPSCPLPAGGCAGRHGPRGSRTAGAAAAAAGRLGGGARACRAPRGAPAPQAAAGAAGGQRPGRRQLAALRPGRHAAADGRVSCPVGTARCCAAGAVWNSMAKCATPNQAHACRHLPCFTPPTPICCTCPSACHQPGAAAVWIGAPAGRAGPGDQGSAAGQRRRLAGRAAGVWAWLLLLLCC